MFNAHRIGSETLSVKNLVLLFLTIVLNFASIITLNQANNISNIQNTQHTIKWVTMTNNTQVFDYKDNSNWL